MPFQRAHPWSWAGTWAIVLPLAGCPGPSTGDAGDVATDLGWLDRPSPDEPAADSTADRETAAPMDAVVAPDSGVQCRMVPVEDLASVGTREGALVRVRGDNRAAQDSISIGLQDPTDLSCSVGLTRERIFQYTLRGDAALRISTSHPGTTPNWSTGVILGLGPRCNGSTPILGCSFDDPTHYGNDARSAALMTSAVLTAGTVVFVGVGARDLISGFDAMELGDFELTVEELTPAAPGAPCDPFGRDSVCQAGTTCVAETGDVLGTCRSDGTTAGARCVVGTCDAPATCNLASDRCEETLTAGQTCHADKLGNLAFRRCGAMLTCVPETIYAPDGTCVADGSLRARCLPGGVCTDPSDLCGPAGTCVRFLPPDSACGGAVSCPSPQVCVQSSLTGRVGVCRNPGAEGVACSAGPCAPGLTCVSRRNALPDVCALETPDGGVCSVSFATCRAGSSCRLDRENDPDAGHCLRDGALGGRCRTGGSPCDAGLLCGSDGTRAAIPICVEPFLPGSSCPVSAPNCPAAEVCFFSDPSRPDGLCVGEGASAGAPCRLDGSPPCEPGLTCSSPGLLGTCLADSGLGTCDEVRIPTLACPADTACFGADFGPGACVATVPEREPNHTFATAQPIPTLPASVRGVLAQRDRDCLRITVPDAGRLVARVQQPNQGVCLPFGLGLEFARADGVLLGRWQPLAVNPPGYPADACVWIDGRLPSFPWARGLAGGDYLVCVVGPATASIMPPSAALEYVLDLDARGP